VQLDSLSDIMTCSVGIVLFVMIQAVLTGNAFVVRRDLPWVDTEAKLEPTWVLCQGGEVIPLKLDPVVKRMLARRPLPDTREGLINWLEWWQQQHDENELIEVWGYVNVNPLGDVPLDVGVKYQPKRNIQFDTIETVGQPSSLFIQHLSQCDPQKEYISFAVDPASIDLLEVAAKTARERHFRIGWQPETMNWPRLESLMGGPGKRRGGPLGGIGGL